MNILYTILAYEPAFRVGGPVLTLKATAEGLVKGGHQVTVVASNANMDEDLDVPVNQRVDVNGVSVWYFQRKSLLPAWLPGYKRLSGPMGYVYTPDLRNHLSELVRDADVVHTQMPFTYATHQAARAASRFGKPLFYSQHGLLAPRSLKFRSIKKRLYLSVVERSIMKSAAMLVALTDWEKQAYRALDIKTPCEIVPNGIDPSEYGGDYVDTVEARWAVRRNKLLVLFLGRLHPMKGPKRLLSAFLSIADQFPEAVLVIAGPDEWGMVNDMRRQAAAAGCGDRVIFPGMLLGADKLALLARADLFCLPSESEGFSVSVLEAMASRTAVLLSPECHFDTVAGRGAGVIAPYDVQPLSAALSSLLRNRSALREMGTAARDFAVSQYSWERVVDRLSDLYRASVDRQQTVKADWSTPAAIDYTMKRNLSK